ncbi:MAG: class I SAM-dependent methyltransferase [Betaproteobacteria bacterium]
MQTTDFTEIAARYERDSLIQKSAAAKLIRLLNIQRNDDVLDLGCGTGALARKIRTMTDGNIIGVDPSEGMICEAESKRDGQDITFSVQVAERLDYLDQFTVIFCNSAFQWFRDPHQALKNCYAALERGGRMGIQAPAKKIYCPNFLAAMEAVARDPRTANTLSSFRPPWIFLDTAEEYSSLFKQAGFIVPFAVIEEIKTLHAPGQVITIFESGAAAGYLNQEFYGAPIAEAYTKAFREIVRESFLRQANKEGQVELIFNRIYLLAVK